MSSRFGNNVTFSVFGQSHSEAIGVVIDGLPAGEAIDMQQVQAFMDRRAPGNRPSDTPRREADVPRVLSGLVHHVTCGAPLCAVIQNTDTHPEDYEKLRDIPRPGHADYPLRVKFQGFQDIRGGGHASGRLTAPLCFAGAVCAQILARKGIELVARIVEMGDVKAAAFTGDSVGGVIECEARGLPAGLGEPMFGGVENRLAAAIFGIPAVRGIEFGAGFAAARMKGSEHNDAYRLEGEQVRTATNHHGGVLGGVTTGMPLVFRIAIKPTPSIARTQTTVDFARNRETELAVGGRHDVCIVPRVVPVAEAVTACVLLDLLLDAKGVF
ncbi:MAG: chorismate synthase [Oscillospiraceae bacterium]|jgi:chorismate synthase|nr:chorismate synthase [Oscillospiraceae bacterium]